MTMTARQIRDLKRRIGATNAGSTVKDMLDEIERLRGVLARWHHKRCPVLRPGGRCLCGLARKVAIADRAGRELERFTEDLREMREELARRGADSPVVRELRGALCTDSPGSA